jgi:hypothetical protein
MTKDPFDGIRQAARQCGTDPWTFMQEYTKALQTLASRVEAGVKP